MQSSQMNLKEKDLQCARNALEMRHIEDPYTYIQSLLRAYDLLNRLEEEQHQQRTELKTGAAQYP